MVTRIQAIRRRRRQRGMSVLIVFLVITMLMGIGVYASRSSILSTSMAGSTKQLAQTRNLSEYAVMNATAALARDPGRYVQQMPRYVTAPGDPKCYGFATVPNATCFPLGLKQLQDEANAPLVVPADPANKIPGGLGFADLDADFNIDITDLAPAAPPVAGEALNADSPVKVTYLSLTLTATGQIRAKVQQAADMQQNLALNASVQSWRAHVVVGPLSNPAARPPPN